MRSRFETLIFLTAAGTGVAAAILTAVLIAWPARQDVNRRLEERLRRDAALVAALVEQQGEALADEGLDGEADRLGELLDARVTLVTTSGQVVGDSALAPADFESADVSRGQEVLDAARKGQGLDRRTSATSGADTIFAAAATRHPTVAYVRVAAPALVASGQLQKTAPLALLSIAVIVPLALLAARVVAQPLRRRVRTLVGVAERYVRGDTAREPGSFGDDELGVVARSFDGALHATVRRLDELASGRARMEAILAGMVEGVLVVDAQGRVTLANEAARRMLGVDGAAGRHHTEVIRHPDIVAQVGAALRGEEPAGVEFALGPEPARHFVARAAAARDSGNGDAVLVLHEITDLRKADQIRRDFVANVSHELRTPLTAIRGYVETLLEETPGGETRGFLEIIARHSARMERLVGDLLRLARLDAGQESVSLASTDLTSICEAILNELKPAADARGSVVRIEVDEPARVLVTDGPKLHDVLRNLIENAVHYSEGGAVDVTARRSDETIVVEVADEGPGIPPADLQRVFERFYRVDKSRARSPGGTGLGLAIVKHLVGLLGGQVSAANRPAAGAVFSIVLPAEPAAAGGAPEAAS